MSLKDYCEMYFFQIEFKGKDSMDDCLLDLIEKDDYSLIKKMIPNEIVMEEFEKFKKMTPNKYGAYSTLRQAVDSYKWDVDRKTTSKPCAIAHYCKECEKPIEYQLIDKKEW